MVGLFVMLVGFVLTCLMPPLGIAVMLLGLGLMVYSAVSGSRQKSELREMRAILLRQEQQRIVQQQAKAASGNQGSAA